MPQLLTIQAARSVAANLVVLSNLSIVEAKYTRGDVLPVLFCLALSWWRGRPIYRASRFSMEAGHKDLPDLLADFAPIARACDRGPHFYQLIDTDAHLIAAIILANSGHDAAFARGRRDACPQTILLFGVLDFSCLKDSNLGRRYWMGHDPLVDSDHFS